jgi:hypothetical protein
MLRSVHVGFIVYKVAVRKVFSLTSSGFLVMSFHLCSVFTHVSCGGWTVGPLVVLWLLAFPLSNNNINNNCYHIVS